MRKSSSGSIVYSPSDLIRFMQSPFASWMDRYHLERPGELPPDAADAQLLLVADEGNKHEEKYLLRLKSEGLVLAEIVKDRDFSASVVQTLKALNAKSPGIYQGALIHDNFAGYSDFLLLGADGCYEVWDTKLGRSPRPYYLVQLCAYAEMLEAMIGLRCDTVGVVLVSDQNRLRTTGNPLDLRKFKASEYRYYYQQIKRAFLELMKDFVPDLETRPIPGASADHGRWQSYADRWFEATDHLSRVARITNGQIKKWENVSVNTMAALAQAQSLTVAQMAEDVRLRLINQARVQVKTREARKTDPDTLAAYEVISGAAAERRGLQALPPPDPGDIYFDMEGYPLVVGGLEYLFGVCYHEEDELKFRDWWAHDRREEKKAFEDFIDWAFERWRRHPGLHIYHYAAYEVSALRRLSTGHATREKQVDQLLRSEVFVDLYQVVREGILLGEDSYSLKKVELLYRPKRQEGLSTAGDSIVEYANWMASGQPADPATSAILKAIRDYNEEDCRSTAGLVFWLRQLQAQHGHTYVGRSVELDDDEDEAPEMPMDATRRKLMEAAYDVDGQLLRPHLETLAHLLDFHRRENKPMWWRMFDRIVSPPEKLAEDIECLSLVRATGSTVAEKKSVVQGYCFAPDEDTKISAHSTVMFAHQHGAKFTVIGFDHHAGTLALKISANKLKEHFQGQFPQSGALIPYQFVSPEPIPAAIGRAALAYLDGAHPLLGNLLDRKPPLPHAGNLVLPDESPTQAAIRIANLMDHSVLCVQGPPGTGKTYTGSHVINSLLRAGMRVGVMSNSHKAILNLVRAVGDALPNPQALRGVKIGGDGEDPIFQDFPNFMPVNSGTALAAYQTTGGLVAGTAWAFSREEWEGALDYLIVDEAGQVCVANLVGVSLAAKNVILLGDQMQLEQPIQGTHPGQTGQSALQYYLQDHATIPRDLGIFLDCSYRMHPDVCRFVSETVYEGRLTSVPNTGRQLVAIEPNNRLITKEAGIVFLGVKHDGNVQGSDEEIETIVAVLNELKGSIYVDSGGVEHSLGIEDFLFISPYNLQVNRLRARLPQGARVGSVDKIQGQEAAVAIFSLGSSFGEYGSRGLSFLLNRNRMNVAISRAQCLAIVVGDPRIGRTEVSSLEEMSLVNLYCRLLQTTQ